MTDCEIVLSDIETLYLGNLGTVEFDLDLPRAGKHGSTITWESDAPHFLDAEGRGGARVTVRPPRGGFLSEVGG